MAPRARVTHRMKRLLPFWAIQFAFGAAVVVIVSVVAIAAVSNVTRLPSAFFDEVGRTVRNALPKEAADLGNDDQLKVMLRAMPGGRLRVGSVIGGDDVVVFTVTAKRSAVRAAVVPGDQLRLNRDSGEIEIAPQGIPGIVHQLQDD